MVKILNKTASNYVTDKVEFNGSNTFARWDNGLYIVYSFGYHFPMYIFDGFAWFENCDKYSPSTSKQQTQLRPDADKFEMLNTNELKQMINNQ